MTYNRAIWSPRALESEPQTRIDRLLDGMSLREKRERILAAFNAGIDVMLWPGEEYFEVLAQAVQTGEVSMDRLDQSVRRILAFKEHQGLFNPADQSRSDEQVTVMSHQGAQDFARSLAGNSLTLVRNRRNVLPLKADRIKSALILYAAATPSAAATRVDPFRKALEARGIKVKVHVNGNCLDVVKMEESGLEFGHGGYGGATGFANVPHGLAIGIVINRMGGSLPDELVDD